jgi:hypothetical protein
MLQTLTEKTGLPIPIRMWAAGAKVDMEAMFHDLEQDEQIRRRIEKITGTKLPSPSETGNEAEGGEFASALSRLHRKATIERGTGVQRLPLLARKYPEHAYEMKGKSKTGKDKWIRDQRAASTQVNAMIAKAVAKLQDPNVKASALKRVASELGRVPNILDIPTRGV